MLITHSKIEQNFTFQIADQIGIHADFHFYMMNELLYICQHNLFNVVFIYIVYIKQLLLYLM